MSHPERFQVGRPSNTLHYAVGVIDGKLDQVLATLLLDRENVKDLDGRLTAVERNQWKVAGGVSVVVFLIGSWEVFQYVVRR